MQPRQRNISTLVTFSVISLLLAPQIAMSSGGGNKYKVTITNLTSGQPFTPPVIATHSHKTGIFSLAEDASEAVQAIAENGNNMLLVAALADDVHVYEVIEGTAPIIPDSNPGAAPFESTATFTISTHRNAKYLSFVSMLICTNDGFTGIDTVALPSRKRTVYAVAYDARTEKNTEDFVDMVPPCQGLIGVSSDDMGTGDTNPLLSETGFVTPHVGIHGGADLVPQVHGWGDPVAKIVIERIRNNHKRD